MNCLNCNNVLRPPKGRKSLGDKKYCNNSCQHKFQTRCKMQDFLNGKYVGKLLQFRHSGDGEWTRRLLIEEKGYKCAKCAIFEWHHKSLTLEVNHIDGDALNNVLDNLEFLCPNCHSQTDTFRAKNLVSSRSHRKASIV